MPSVRATIAHLEETNSEAQGWQLQKEPLLHRVTAVKTEQIESL